MSNENLMKRLLGGDGKTENVIKNIRTTGDASLWDFGMFNKACRRAWDTIENDMTALAVGAQLELNEYGDITVSDQDIEEMAEVIADAVKKHYGGR